jgi:hypothetical protein
MLLLLPAALFANVPEIGWPRAIEAAEGEIVIYQPQLDSLEGDKLTGRAAVSVALTDSEEPVFGVIRFESRMETDRDARTMRIVDLDITHVGFTDATDAQKDRFGAFVESEILEWDLTLSLDRVLASLAVVEQEREAARGLKFDPPRILYTDSPSVLVMIDGKPRFKALEDSTLERLVNSPFTVVSDAKNGKYYLDGGTTWYVAGDVMGPREVDNKPPKKVAKLRSDEAAKAAREAATGADSRTPRIVVATEPTELIVTDGSAAYTPLTIELLGVTNSESDLLLEIESQRYFVVFSGRWYASKALDGPWVHVPGEFYGHPERVVTGTRTRIRAGYRRGRAGRARQSHSADRSHQARPRRVHRRVRRHAKVRGDRGHRHAVCRQHQRLGAADRRHLLGVPSGRLVRGHIGERSVDSGDVAAG